MQQRDHIYDTDTGHGLIYQPGQTLVAHDAAFNMPHRGQESQEIYEEVQVALKHTAVALSLTSIGTIDLHTSARSFSCLQSAETGVASTLWTVAHGTNIWAVHRPGDISVSTKTVTKECRYDVETVLMFAILCPAKNLFQCGDGADDSVLPSNFCLTNDSVAQYCVRSGWARINRDPLLSRSCSSHTMRLPSFNVSGTLCW